MSRDPKSSYYDVGGIETMDIVKAKLTKEQFKGFLMGNILKYSCRAFHKTPRRPQRDIEKIGWYRQELTSLLSPKEENIKEDLSHEAYS